MSEETKDPIQPQETAASTAAGEGEQAAGPSASRESPETPSAAAGRTVRTATPPAEKSSGGGWGLLLGAVVVVAGLGAGAYFTRDQWLPLIGPIPGLTADEKAETTGTAAGKSAEQQALDSLDARLAALESSVAQIKSSVESLANDTATRDLTASVGLLNDRVTRLERTSIDISSLQREFGELNRRAIALREGFSGLNATVLAANQLAQSVDEGVAYTRPLAALRAVAGSDEAITSALNLLEPYAATGIPSFASLRSRFPAVADAVARAAPTTGGAEWYERAFDQVLSLVTVRVTGEAAARAGGIDAILATAESALAGGDLAAAVAEVERLEGQAAAAAADWLQAAKHRLTATEAVARLQEQAAVRLAQAKG